MRVGRRYCLRRFFLPLLLVTQPLSAETVQADAFSVGMRALEKGDYAVAYCLWKPLAERGLAAAQYHIGWLYANGNGLAVDIGQAMTWWKRAATQGHADSQFAVGLAYTTGEGVGKNLEKAVDWYLVAARQGHQDAREILVRLNGEPDLDLLDRHPEIVSEEWFGWPATIEGDRINVRDGPGTGYKVVAQLGQGSRVRVVGRRDEWLRVVLDSGETAWIFEGLVSNL